MIDADVTFGIAEFLATHSRAAVGATVDESMDRAVLVATDDDRSVTDIDRLEVTRVGDLGLEGEIVPGRAAENPVLFLLVQFRIVIDAEGNASEVVAGPCVAGFILHLETFLYLDRGPK